MNEVIFKTLKEKDFIVKNYLIKVAIELHLSLNECVLLIYFMNQDNPSLNIDNIKRTVYLTEEEIMEAFTKLSAINLITVNVVKNPDGTREEVISLDNIIKCATSDIAKKQKEDDKNNIFDVFEREFGRGLSSMEFEIINEWLNKYSKELITEALRDAIYNNQRNLKYISSKLDYWNEKGYKNKKDISEGLKLESESSVLTELFDYNWLEDE